MDKYKQKLYLEQIDTDVSFFSFMTIAVIFFTGLLLTNFDSYDLLIKVPISFLIISIFAFLYPALILANTSQKIISGEIKHVKRHLLYGYTISEYLGIYLFILSLPLIINAFTSDLYLRMTTLLSSLIGLIIYQFLHFSNLEIHFPKKYKIFSIIMIIFGLLLFISQAYNFYFVPVAIVFLSFIIFITYSSVKENFQ
jgi:hypothetical protein|tara:strand:- start:1036 stop:1626 length:591 start_codon:yes stop_codon:yes gene_type:complete